MRYYERVWNKLKTDKVAQVTANPVHHRRIVKAVIKEKWMDSVYKLEMEDFSVTLEYHSSYSIITFRLKIIRKNWANIEI